MKVIAILLSCFVVCFSPAIYADEQAASTESPAAITENTSEQAAAPEQEALTEEEQYMVWARELWHSLDKQTGVIKLPEGSATLNVPETFYYLNPQDTEKVLVEVWGNPPGQKTLGMLFPADTTPFDTESWGVTLGYEEEGYVDDKDAGSIDYEEMLVQMKEDTKAESEQRVEQGYGPIELIGWAAKPYYDEASKKLHWAQELNFGEEANTLNYNIRILGRKGFLLLNFIAAMEQKQAIEASLDSVLALAEFDAGARYGDFNPDIDTVAAYGIGALVAGKVMAKTGFLVAAVIFLKKFGIIFVVALGALFVKLFKRKQTEAA